MKILLILILLFLSPSVWADENRYVDNKVLYEAPQEADILRVNTALGYCTVLEFPEKPTMVTVGDNSMVQVEVPQNSKNVVIKPLENSGETNLFVFTQNQRFNYKVVIGDETQVDYVIDAKEAKQRLDKKQKPISLGELFKKAKNYSVLKDLKDTNDREFRHKDLFYPCVHSALNVNVIEAFINKNPHYLILHVVVQNKSEPIEINEKNTNVYINGQKFTPKYVVFDSTQLGSNEKSDGWLILEDTFVSLDNKFTFGIGVRDEEYICQ